MAGYEGEVEAAEELEIKASLISGNEIDLRLSGDATMSELRERIEKTMGVPAELQRIFVGAQEVEAAYNVAIKDALGTAGAVAVTVVLGESFEEVVLEDFTQQLPSRLLKEKVIRKGMCAKCFRFRDRFTGKRVLVSFYRNLQVPSHDGQPLHGVVKDLFLMKHLNHPNLVKLLDVPPISPPHFCVLTEWMDTDLGTVIRSKQELTEDHCRYFTYQILEALCYLHSAGVIYCELTPHRVLLKANCDLKLKQLEDAKKLGSTLSAPGTGFMSGNPWYRAPETFLSCMEDEEAMTGACDIWSAGCLLYEMYQREVLFNCTPAVAQMKLICKVLGPPEGASWFRGRSKELLRQNLPDCDGPPISWAAKVPKASDEGCQMLQQMILWDPGSRPSAKEALQHALFLEIRDPEDEKVDQCSTPIDWDQLQSLEAHEPAVNFLQEEFHSRHPGLV